jgi:hypothetical protein
MLESNLRFKAESFDGVRQTTLLGYPIELGVHKGNSTAFVKYDDGTVRLVPYGHALYEDQFGNTLVLDDAAYVEMVLDFDRKRKQEAKSTPDEQTKEQRLQKAIRLVREGLSYIHDGIASTTTLDNPLMAHNLEICQRIVELTHSLDSVYPMYKPQPQNTSNDANS